MVCDCSNVNSEQGIFTCDLELNVLCTFIITFLHFVNFDYRFIKLLMHAKVFSEDYIVTELPKESWTGLVRTFIVLLNFNK